MAGGGQGAGPGQPPRSPIADQTRFDAFRPDAGAGAGPPAARRPGLAGPAQPATPSAPQAREAEQPFPQIRNGRVLLAVLCAAVLPLVVPLGIVWLATRSSGPSFEVGSCVRRSGSEAVAAQCSDSDAFTVVAKVTSQDKCTDPPGQPYVVVADGSRNNVLCLRPAAGR